MLCPICQGTTRRFGKNRNGSQRFRCDACRKTHTDEQTRPVDRRCLSPEKAIFCLRLLLEGNSIRSVERLTCVHRDTIILAMIDAGEKCKRFLEADIRRVEVQDVQADEIWGYVQCKEKTRQRLGHDEAHGDAYCFTALERTTKLLICWHLGKRCPSDTLEFAEKLRHATNGRFQLTTDGFRPYLNTIPFVFGPRVDFATLVKVYSATEEDSRRYSPGTVVDTIVTPRTGDPDPARICTSHVERSNLTLRMQIRQLTRLTNAFSKKWSNHEAALALFFAYYNFCRVHGTIKTTPAVKAGLAAEPWSVQRLLEEAARV
jgi:transposase-like protein/IS1 family transposase